MLLIVYFVSSNLDVCISEQVNRNKRVNGASEQYGFLPLAPGSPEAPAHRCFVFFSCLAVWCFASGHRLLFVLLSMSFTPFINRFRVESTWAVVMFFYMT